MSFYKEVPGRQTTLESALKFDIEPTAGSTNPVTSGGVATAITEAVGDASDALQEQIDDIAEKAGSGYTPKGEASVATLNGLSGQENGWLYTMTDAGTLTDGSLAVVAGDTVAWDATNSVWYKAMNYAPSQYGTNEVHNLPTTASEPSLIAGNYLALDGSAGTKKLPAEILGNTEKSIASLFSNASAYNINDIVMNNGKLYIFVRPHTAGTPFSSDEVEEESLETLGETFTHKFVGISRSGSPGSMLTYEFDCNGYAVIIPALSLWSCQYAQYYALVIGYVDGNGVSHDLYTYNESQLSTIWYKKFTLTGYNRCYIKIRADQDVEVVTTIYVSSSVASTHYTDSLYKKNKYLINKVVQKFDTTKAYEMGDFVEYENEFYQFIKPHAAGAFDSSEVFVSSVDNLCDVFTHKFVGISVPGSTGSILKFVFDIKGQAFVIPSATAWSVQNVTSYAIAVGYIDDDDVSHDLYHYTANQVASYYNVMFTISGYKKGFLAIRADKGTEVVSTIATGSSLAGKEFVKATVSDAVSALSDSVDTLDSNVSNFEVQSSCRDFNNRASISVNTSTLTESDLPSVIVPKKNTRIELKPIFTNLGGMTWGQGFAIAPNGKVLSALYFNNYLRLVFGDLNKLNGESFIKDFYLGWTPHANFMWFGNAKYDESDVYPLLYVGGLIGNEGEGPSNVLVIRIVGDASDAENVSYNLVQTITLPASISNDGILSVNNVGGKLVALRGKDVWVFGAFPAYNAGDVTLTDADITDTITLTSTMVAPYQSAIEADGMLYAINGYADDTQMNIIDVSAGTCKDIPLPSFGECEGLSIYNGKMYASNKVTDYFGETQQLVISSVDFFID